MALLIKIQGAVVLIKTIDGGRISPPLRGLEARVQNKGSNQGESSRRIANSSVKVKMCPVISRYLRLQFQNSRILPGQGFYRLRLVDETHFFFLVVSETKKERR